MTRLFSMLSMRDRVIKFYNGKTIPFGVAVLINVGQKIVSIYECSKKERTKLTAASYNSSQLL